MLEKENAIVLNTEFSGESFLKLYLITAKSGVFLCLKKVSRNTRSSSIPDLFDHAFVILERSQQGNVKFIKEYQLIRRRERIGTNYKSLSCASYLSQLLVNNSIHLPESKALFDLIHRSFDAFADGKVPEIVLVKSLYLFLSNEGYPVRESWWPTLRHDLNPIAKQILMKQAPKKMEMAEHKICKEICEQLKIWMRQHTDLILSE